MVNQVVLTTTANTNFRNIVAYLFTAFGNKASDEFINRFENVKAILSQTPTIYSTINAKRKIRKCVLTKHNVLYFRVYKHRVEIIKIFDTRQNPEKLKDIL